MDGYEQAEAYLYGRINYERAHAAGWSADDVKLDRMRALLALLGNPQRGIPSVHIAGTKGKGSTAALCASALRAAGHRVGLYTSPHVSRFEERMTVNGRMPDNADVVRLVARVRDAVGLLEGRAGEAGPTFFEILTAMAWLHFAERGVEVVVLEVGLGGRLDATNVCEPAVCVITNISRDHTPLLGHTLADIAAEKAGIVKPGVPVVSGATAPEAARVIAASCARHGAPLYELGRAVVVHDIGIEAPADAAIEGATLRAVAWQPPAVDVSTPWRRWTGLPVVLLGKHQATNAALAAAALDVLRSQGWAISDEAVRDGFGRVSWPLRIEVVRSRPKAILDAAHNWASMRALLATLDEMFPPERRVLIFAGTRDKDVAGLLRLALPRFDSAVFTPYLDNPRAVPVEQLASLARSLGDIPFHVARSPREAWDIAAKISNPDDLIVGTGSFFLAAELRDVLCPPGSRADAVPVCSVAPGI